MRATLIFLCASLVSLHEELARGYLAEVEALSIGDHGTSTSVDEQHARAPLPWNGKPCSSKGCLPSFLIIGAGKAGTSSLYYYLQDHPHVQKARQKQVQFFDHQWSRGLPWYLSHFPRRMPEGHVTGEASPGYIVYSRVPALVLSATPQARIIALVREPIDRLWSSYHYNYLDVLQASRSRDAARLGVQWNGEHRKRSGGLDVKADAEHFVGVEIAMLKECFDAHGYSPRRGTGPRGVAGNKGDATEVESPRSKLLDVTETCINSVPLPEHLGRIRKAVVDASLPSLSISPGDVQFPSANSHLYRQFVTRGLYSIMLEHWFAIFPGDQIAVVCTEALAGAGAGSDSSITSTASSSSPSEALSAAARTVARVAVFIGLDPSLANDFKETVASGKFNAAANRGYEKVTTWEAAAKSERERPAMDLSLSRTLQEFYAPFNERLFELSGGRCHWP